MSLSEIRVNTLKTRTGVGTITYTETGPIIAGIVTSTGLDVNGNGDISGNLSVGGVLTYEDVTNIDSVGIITARGGITNSGGNISLADRPDGSNHNLFFGTGAKAGIYHDGTNFTLINNTGHTYIGIGAANKDLMLYAQSTGNIILQRNTGHKYFEGVGSDGTAIIYFNTNEKLRTTNTGVSITGIPVATQNTGNIGLELHATGSGRGSQTKYHNDHGEAYVGTAGDTTGNLLIHNTSNTDMLFATNNLERLRIESDGDVNIGAAADNTAIHASGLFNAATPKFEVKLGAASNSYTRLINITNPGAQTGSETLGRVGIKLSLGSEASSGESNKSGIIYAESTSGYNNGTSLCFATSNTERLRISSTGQLHLSGANSSTTGTSATDLLMANGGVIRHRNAAGNAWINTFGLDSSNNIKIGWGGSPNEIHFGISGIGEQMMLRSTGDLIIGNGGTNFGNATVQSFSAHGNTAGESGFSSVDTTSVAAGVGGEIAFHGKFNTGAQDYAYLGHIRGIKENATAGNTACALTFWTRPNATAPIERLRIDSNGHVIPATNNTYDLGSTAKGWRNVYTNDLNLSNLPATGNDSAGNPYTRPGNDVDGTNGSWTIQEGKDDLYIINRLDGKKYKFNLTEVS